MSDLTYDPQGLALLQPSGRVLPASPSDALAVEVLPADAWAETTYSVPASPSGLNRAHSIQFSRRFGIVSRWSIGGVPIMSRNDNTRSLQGQEVLRPDANLAGESRHTPNMGGGTFRSFGHGLAQGTAQMPTACHRELHPPRVAYYTASQNGSELLLESCTGPMDASADGWEHGAAADHGGNRDTAVHYRDARMFLRLRLNTLLLPADCAELTFWSYSPDDWSIASGRMSAIEAVLRSGFQLCNHFGAASFYDFQEGRFTSVSDWSSANSLRLRATRAELALYGDVTRTDAGPLTSDCALGILHTPDLAGSGDPLAVGILARIHGTLADPSSRNNTRPSWIELQGEGMASGLIGDGVDYSPRASLSVMSVTTTGRRVGWIGHRYWIIFRPTREDVVEALRPMVRDGLYRMGEADAPPFDLPAAARRSPGPLMP